MWYSLFMLSAIDKRIFSADVKDVLVKFLVHYQEEFGYELEDAIVYFRNT